MPQVLPTHVPAPRCVIGWDGTAYRAFAVDASGHIQADVLSSTLPAGAATAANQLTMITALQLIDDLRGALTSVWTDQLTVMANVSGTAQAVATRNEQQAQTTALELIDDLRNALQSVATDRLKVRGEDQLFSFRGVLAVAASGNPSGADGYIESPAVPAGQVWVVTTVIVRDATRALTEVDFVSYHDGTLYMFGTVVRAIAVNEPVPWSGHVYLDAGDTIRCDMTGCQAGDDCSMYCLGYRMTAET